MQIRAGGSSTMPAKRRQLKPTEKETIKKKMDRKEQTRDQTNLQKIQEGFHHHISKDKMMISLTTCDVFEVFRKEQTEQVAVPLSESCGKHRTASGM